MHHMPRTAACTNLSTVRICLLSLYLIYSESHLKESMETFLLSVPRLPQTHSKVKVTFIIPSIPLYHFLKPEKKYYVQFMENMPRSWGGGGGEAWGPDSPSIFQSMGFAMVKFVRPPGSEAEPVLVLYF